VFATAMSRSVLLTWTPPAVTAGAKVESYTVIAEPGAAPVTTAATTATITGLTNGTPYVFEVSATTANGTGPIALSNIVVPGGGLVPSAPIGVVAAARDREATVSWAPPASPGGSAITAYYVTVTPGGTGEVAKTTSLLVGGLTNGVTYVFSVEALNAAGASSSAASNAVIPLAGAGVFDGGAFDGAFADAGHAVDAGHALDAGHAVDGPRGVDAPAARDASHDAASARDARSDGGREAGR